MLYEHQKVIRDHVVNLLYVRETPGASGCAVFSGLGSGKTRATLDALRLLSEVESVRRTLVVGPNRVITHTWPDEIRKWGYQFKYGHVTSRHKCPNPDPLDLVFCSPDSLHHCIAPARHFDCVVVDESTYFKNYRTERMRSMRRLLKRIPKRVILSATPMPNSHADLFSQFWIVDGGRTLGKTLSEFRREYMQKGGFRGREWSLLPGASDRILEAVRPLSIFLDSKDLVDLPELVHNEVVVDLPTSARAVHRQLKVELLAELDSGTVFAANAAVAYGKMRQLANGFLMDEDRNVRRVHEAKVEAFREVVTAAAGEQVLVFYHYVADRDALAGPDTTTDFNEWMAGKKQVLLLQIRSAAHGLNAQTSGAHHMVFFGVPDSNELFRQAIGRLHRPGGAKRVFCHRIVAKDSVEDVIYDRIEGRQGSQADFLNALKAWARS